MARWRSSAAARANLAGASVLIVAAVLGSLGWADTPVEAASGSLRATSRLVTGTVAGFPNGEITLEGHGFGPGIGMGQWGAFGYAAEYHETYAWILSHYYGGTRFATEKSNPKISVSIMENRNAPVTVTSRSTYHFGPVTVPAGVAARAVLDRATGLWSVSTGSGCRATSWKTQASALRNPVAVPVATAWTATPNQLLTLCLPGGRTETVRGEVEAYDYDGNGTPKERELNIIRLQQYLGDVVPSESSAGWGEVGGAGPQSEPWGFQELEAQAVAARTYALAYEAAGGWYGYASICDNYFCQAYPGITNESAVSTAAVADTARQYLTLDGRPAETEYSASTGGYTVESSFPAVPDAGDAVCLTNTGLWTCNPEHTWNVTISVSQLESALPSIGTLNSISITARNGLGSLGGRVLSITVSGSKGSVTESGTAFQYQFGLYSDWFAITNETTSGTPRRISSGGAEFSRGTGPLP